MDVPELIQFETERLRLRQWRKSDLKPFAAMNADPQVMEFFPSPLTRRESDSMAEKLRALIEQRGWGFWAVEIPGVAPFIGVVGLHVAPAALPFAPCVEIGWRLAAAYWGQGHATEAARGVLRVGFEQLELPEIVSFTSVLNQRSRAVMERIGMQHRGELFEHPSVPVGSPLRPHILYRLSRTEWSEQRPRIKAATNANL
jgi:RimJ/RimL family protein N-acetyltransferase